MMMCQGTCLYMRVYRLIKDDTAQWGLA